MPLLLCRFQQAELVHSRTAMTAVAGILFPAVINLHTSSHLRITMLFTHRSKFFGPL